MKTGQKRKEKLLRLPLEKLVYIQIVVIKLAMRAPKNSKEPPRCGPAAAPGPAAPPRRVRGRGRGGGRGAAGTSEWSWCVRVCRVYGVSCSRV